MFASHASRTSGALRWNMFKLLRSRPAVTPACCRSHSSVSKALYYAPLRIDELGRRAQLCTVISMKEDEVQNSASAPEEESFKQLLDNSRFVKSIDPVGKTAEGEILAVSGEKVYVDFGSKFHAVVDIPKEKRECYVKGAKVIILVKNLEMTGHFLGAQKHISLLEAEAELVGLANSNT